MKKTSSMSKDGSNLTKSRFDCYFRCSLVNLKNFKNLFWKQNSFLETKFFFGTCGLFMVCEKVEEVLFLIQNISKTIRNNYPKSLNSIPNISKFCIKNWNQKLFFISRPYFWQLQKFPGLWHNWYFVQC